MRWWRYIPVVILLLSASAQQDAGIWLEIPELGARFEGNSAQSIPSTDFQSFVIRLGKKSTQVEYGSITSKINTESANIVMTTASTDDGILCRFDLARFAGFQLKPGRNSIEIFFEDRWKHKYYASFLLQAGSRPGEAPFRPSKPERTTAEKYAVIIGVSRYQHAGQGLPNLRYADRDASAFRDFLLSPEGGAFKRENVKYLINEDATSQNVRSALFTFLTRPKEQDLVVLYVAAHGSPDPNDRRNLYILTSDTRIDDMGGTAFPMWQLQDVFGRIIKARRVITLTDTCHSYGISGQQYGGSSKSNNLINQYLAAYATAADRAVITASDISELSAESERWGGGHGVFTHFVLEGLKGKADLDQDGTVTTGELFRYVSEEVPKATDHQQTPIALPGLARNLPLAGALAMAARGPGRAQHTGGR
jgi:uncharacterized caspase-like protein